MAIPSTSLQSGCHASSLPEGQPDTRMMLARGSPIGPILFPWMSSTVSFAKPGQRASTCRPRSSRRLKCKSRVCRFGKCGELVISFTPQTRKPFTPSRRVRSPARAGEAATLSLLHRRFRFGQGPGRSVGAVQERRQGRLRPQRGGGYTRHRAWLDQTQCGSGCCPIPAAWSRVPSSHRVVKPRRCGDWHSCSIPASPIGLSDKASSSRVEKPRIDGKGANPGGRPIWFCPRPRHLSPVKCRDEASASIAAVVRRLLLRSNSFKPAKAGQLANAASTPASPISQNRNRNSRRSNGQGAACESSNVLGANSPVHGQGGQGGQRSRGRKRLHVGSIDGGSGLNRNR